MNRRRFLAATAALAGTTALSLPALAQGRPPMRTKWNVVESEGYDAIAFLGALSGEELYRRYYAAEADAFLPKLPQSVRDDLPRLAAESTKSSFGLLWPTLANVLSGAGISTLDSVIDALGDLNGRVHPGFVQNDGEADNWAWLVTHQARLIAVFTAMRAAGFGAFRRDRVGPAMAARVAEVAGNLGTYDVVRQQEKLTGRSFDPTINVVLLAFSKPHGAKMQGQLFLQSADYDTATTVRIAAHEMLHPPFPMHGATATAALALLTNDPLFVRIARDHDPKWGYTTVEGLLNEDVCQALDQMISEALGVGRNPADRWTRSDDGIHVLAAGLYGLLRQDGWADSGGDIEAWLAKATAAGRLAPPVLHTAAARVLERSADQLWPVPAKP